MGIIYKIQNKSNGKIYIGQTTRTLEIRLQEHLRHTETYIERAIKKYWIDAFEVSVIEECETLEELNEREIYWIDKFNCKRPKGYNICIGGKNGSPGHILSPESRKKISQSKKGKKNPISDETRRKMIQSRKANNKPVSVETRAKISASRKGKKCSSETRATMSAGRKNKRAVICLETGEIFESIAAAAKLANVASCTISSAVNGRTTGAGGYHWRFADIVQNMN